MTLAEAPIEKKLRINSIKSGEEARKKLVSIGIHIDDILVKLNDSRWGPILLKREISSTAKLAIGRRLAEKIYVDYE